MKKIILIFMLMIICSLLFSKTLDLESAIETAIKSNLEILAEQNGVKSSEWAERNALTNFFPQIKFNSTVVHIDDDTYDASQATGMIPVFDGITNLPTGNYIPFSSSMLSGGFYQTSYQNNITVSQPIFNGGKVIVGYQMAKKASELSTLALQNKINDIVYRTVFAHLGVLKLQELKQVFMQKIEVTEAHKKTAINQQKAGIVLKNEVLRWQVELSKANILVDEIDDNIAIALDNWRDLTGAGIGDIPKGNRLIDYDEKISELLSLDNKDDYITSFLEEVKKNNSTLRSLEISDELVNKQFTMAKGEFLPSVNLQYSYQIENDDKFDFDGEDNWNIAAVISLPIFSSGKNYSNLKKSEYDLKKAKINSESIQRKIILGAKNSVMNLFTTAKKVENSKTSLLLIEENYRLIVQMYEQGMVKGDDLLDAEMMQTAGNLELVTAYYEFILANYELDKWIENGRR